MNFGNFQEWSKQDFLDNSIFWEENFKLSYKTRIENLRDLLAILNRNNILCFLEGKTLLSTVSKSKLLVNDHDDDVGIFKKDKQKLLSINNELYQSGFEIIRTSESMITLIRNYRYIDICIFEKKDNKIGYGNKKFPYENYEDFDSAYLYNIEVKIPKNSFELINKRYNLNRVLYLFKKDYYKKRCRELYKSLVQIFYNSISNKVKRLKIEDEIEYKQSKVFAKYSVKIPIKNIKVIKLIDGKNKLFNLHEVLNKELEMFSDNNTWLNEEPIFFKFTFNFPSFKKNVFILNPQDLNITEKNLKSRYIQGYLIA